MIDFDDTIVALSSGRLPAGIAIIRISGPKTRFVVETICGIVPQPRISTYRHLRNRSGETIDSGPVLFFQGPKSFTGDDSAEFHTHGSKAVVSALLRELIAIDGVRLAEAGEFTRRAFLNGKVDLLKAEALADLVAAETESQRRLALHNSEGAQSALYVDWRRQLIHARAMIEAELDFSDEQDVPGSLADSVWASIEALCVDIANHIDGYRKAEVIRDGFDVVIVGPPNAGKSSLLNALANRDVAIVSEEAGTTRDLVEIILDLDGFKCRITDTAGLRDAPGRVEAIGIDRARKRAKEADLVIRLSDGSVDVDDDFDSVSTIRVRSKIDLSDDLPDQGYDLAISTHTGAGLGHLVAHIRERAVSSAASVGEILPSRLRHVVLLQETLAHMKAIQRGVDGLEIVADHLRLAANALGRIAGSVDPEDLLDVIFSEFCIGK